MFRFVRGAVRRSGCQRAVLTAHNAHFDQGFLMVAAARNGVRRNPFHPFTVLDTASLGRGCIRAHRVERGMRPGWPCARQ